MFFKKIILFCVSDKYILSMFNIADSILAVISGLISV